MENNNMKYINSHFSMEEIAKMVALTIDGVYPKSKNDSNNSEKNKPIVKKLVQNHSRRQNFLSFYFVFTLIFLIGIINKKRGI